MGVGDLWPRVEESEKGQRGKKRDKERHSAVEIGFIDISGGNITPNITENKRTTDKATNLVLFHKI